MASMKRMLDKNNSEQTRALIRVEIRHCLEEERLEVGSPVEEPLHSEEKTWSEAEKPKPKNGDKQAQSKDEKKDARSGDKDQKTTSESAGSGSKSSALPSWLENIYEEQTKRDHLAKAKEKDGPKEKIEITLVVDGKVNVDLEELRRNVWAVLVGSTVSYKQNSQTKSKELSPGEATRITDAFFGKKFLNGYLDRIITVTRNGIHFDSSKKALAAGSTADVPDKYAMALRELSALAYSEFTKRMN